VTYITRRGSFVVELFSLGVLFLDFHLQSRSQGQSFVRWEALAVELGSAEA
jgi:hypothetical protein